MLLPIRGHYGQHGLGVNRMQQDHALIQDIYDAALRPSAMPDVLQRICDRVGAYGAMVFDCQNHGNARQVGLQYVSSSWERDAVLHYLDMFNAEEVSDQDRIADLSSVGNEVNLIHDKRLYNAHVRPGPNVQAMLGYQVSDRFGALLSKETWNMDRFAFQYLIGTPLPDPDQILWAEGILGHLAKAMSIGRTFANQRTLDQALINFLDLLPVGVAVVDARGHTQFANVEMRRIAQDSPSVNIAANGAFSFHTVSGDPEIGALMTHDEAHGRHGARPRREAVFLPGETQDNGLFVEICPIESHPELDKFGAGARLISILDSALSHSINTDILGQFFPLSKSELLVLDLLTQGHSNTEIAEIRARSVETVNSQIKSLLRKTSSRNRTELVKVAVGLSVVSGKGPR